MNRTRKLMAAVTTSLLFSGTVSGPATVVPAFGQAAPQEDESWKTDPQVSEAAGTINYWMTGTWCQYDAATGAVDKTKMKTQEDVAKQFPQFDPALVQKALRYSVYKGWSRQVGDGSKDNPFRYCESASGTD